MKRSKEFMDWAVKNNNFPEYTDSRNGTIYKFHKSIKMKNQFIFATSSNYKKHARYYLMAGKLSKRSSWELIQEITAYISESGTTSKGSKLSLEARQDF